MTEYLPDIPRLYTALAEWLACMLYITALPRRMGTAKTAALSAGALAVMSLFLAVTGSAPLALWIPCMVGAVGLMYGFLWLCCAINAVDTGYFCARAFILAEFAASLEWQLHCLLRPGKSAASPLSLLMLAAVYGGVMGVMLALERRRAGRAAPGVEPKSLASAVVMALTVFAVSNLSFASGQGATALSVLYIRTLVDLAGVLILSMQQEQLREAALHRELDAMNHVLNRQYEQYRQSRESIHLLNRRYHDLKVQISAIRAERDPDRQAAALTQMENGIRMYEAQNKTGNPVLDTLLTAKSLYCQQHGITMTCVADGRLLDFLPTGDICTIVGAALDNATTSATAQPDTEKRLIRVAVYAQNGFVMLRFENYCGAPVPLGPDGLPSGGEHGGYGLKSVRATAEKYGGTATVHSEDGWFVLRVLLPQG